MTQRPLDKILNKISDLIDAYESGVWQSVDNLRVMQRELVSYNYFLSKHNIEYFQQYNAVQYKHKGSVSAGKILAEEQVPELRMIRKIMEAIENVMWSMRSEISIIKKES
jgi:transcription initiation factor IIE alpha subunit